MGLLSEFKAFAVRGNVVDLAIAVVIGAAFGQIVNSLVKDIIMPPIGFLTGGIDFADLFITLSDGDYPSLAAATQAGAATINYGVFINAAVSFLIVAWALFLVVRLILRLRREFEAAEKPAEAVAPAPPPREQMLLEEIRDLLKLQAERR